MLRLRYCAFGGGTLCWPQLAVLFVPSLEAAWRASPLKSFTCTPENSVSQAAADSSFPCKVPGQVSFKALHPPWYSGRDAEQTDAKQADDTLW